jgi:hypothetical protein
MQMNSTMKDRHPHESMVASSQAHPGVRASCTRLIAAEQDRKAKEYIRFWMID